VSLKARLKAEIAATGPISVADYMTRCLHDPLYGYYATRPALGAEGDFLTAPLVSQMFGELIGLWAVEVWARMGRPERFRLVEAGPGDGTLMSDLLRAARLAPAFLAAAELILMETSRPLIARQAEQLAGTGAAPRWIAGLNDLPPGPPMILIANELLDCLPARQFVRTSEGWAERCVGLDAAGELAFGLGRASRLPLWEKDHIGLVVEISPAQAAFAAALAGVIARDEGCALLIDYGRNRPEAGDTLQALRRHAKVDPLDCPGEADLTVWADFPAVARAAQGAGAATTAIVPQGVFLRRLGLDARTAALARARPDQAETLLRQRDRLAEPDQMGHLFKVLAIHPAGRPAPPGFEAPS
jgi:SAM-dependent MidA family methyltransferase